MYLQQNNPTRTHEVHEEISHEITTYFFRRQLWGATNEKMNGFVWRRSVVMGHPPPAP